MSDTTVNENIPIRLRQAVDCFVAETMVNKAAGQAIKNKGKNIFQTRRYTTTKSAVTFTRASYIRQTQQSQRCRHVAIRILAKCLAHMVISTEK
jgi:macrodomain Ter protein organizer (MatP/YcbG family)